MGKAEKAFTVNGFRDWKHASGQKGVLHVHDKCIVHKGAMLAWEESKCNARRGTSVAHQLEANRSQQIQKNRHYLRTVAETLILCSSRDCPQGSQ